MKVGDLVKSVYDRFGNNTHDDQRQVVGIVIHINTDKYKQIKVLTPTGITYWYPAVTEVVDEGG
tara:strand:+ start:182 stop:373 length:192 start_codon:yes stop_codon:yes gene_type:complete